MSRKPVPVYTSEVVWPCFILIELITLIYQSNDEVTYSKGYFLLVLTLRIITHRVTDNGGARRQ